MTLTFITSTLTFPTKLTDRGGHTSILGTPFRADHCQCGTLELEPGECYRCGLLLKEVIDETWRDRARTIAQGQGELRRAA